MTDSQPNKLVTVDDVVEAIGGTTAAAKLCRKSVQSISNARGANRLPSATFLLFQQALAVRGLEAPPDLWGIIDPLSWQP